MRKEKSKGPLHLTDLLMILVLSNDPTDRTIAKGRQEYRCQGTSGWEPTSPVHLGSPWSTEASDCIGHFHVPLSSPRQKLRAQQGGLPVEADSRGEDQAGQQTSFWSGRTPGPSRLTGPGKIESPPPVGLTSLLCVSRICLPPAYWRELGIFTPGVNSRFPLCFDVSSRWSLMVFH